MNAQEPHGNEQDFIPCGAKTRDGTSCKRRPSPGRKRCHLHGGATPIGIGSPHYRHGFYSRYCPAGVLLRGMLKRERQRAAVLKKHGYGEE